jgi:hypothetical protein
MGLKHDAEQAGSAALSAQTSSAILTAAFGAAVASQKTVESEHLATLMPVCAYYNSIARR